MLKKNKEIENIKEKYALKQAIICLLNIGLPNPHKKLTEFDKAKIEYIQSTIALLEATKE